MILHDKLDTSKVEDSPSVVDNIENSEIITAEDLPQATP